MKKEQSKPKKKDEDVPSKPNPALSKVIERNIHTLLELRTRALEKYGLEGRIADAITAFSGSMLFVYIHVVWFGLWIFLNSGLFGMPTFDPFPYGLLTMIVSLEAIFLSTFVLISQNRQSEESERRANLHLHIGLLSEHELTRALQMLEAIQHKLEIMEYKDKDLAELERETRPEDVLAEIERVQVIERKKRR